MPRDGLGLAPIAAAGGHQRPIAIPAGASAADIPASSTNSTDTNSGSLRVRPDSSPSGGAGGEDHISGRIAQHLRRQRVRLDPAVATSAPSGSASARSARSRAVASAHGTLEFNKAGGRQGLLVEGKACLPRSATRSATPAAGRGRRRRSPGSARSRRAEARPRRAERAARHAFPELGFGQGASTTMARQRCQAHAHAKYALPEYGHRTRGLLFRRCAPSPAVAAGRARPLISVCSCPQRARHRVGLMLAGLQRRRGQAQFGDVGVNEYVDLPEIPEQPLLKYVFQSLKFWPPKSAFASRPVENHNNRTPPKAGHHLAHGRQCRAPACRTVARRQDQLGSAALGNRPQTGRREVFSPQMQRRYGCCGAKPASTAAGAMRSRAG